MAHALAAALDDAIVVQACGVHISPKSLFYLVAHPSRRNHSMRIDLVLALSLAFGFGPTTPTTHSPTVARVTDWVLLGTRTVTDRADHDVIAVTVARGDFKRIKLSVQRAAVDFHKVVVHFANGGKQEIELRHTIPAGGESRAIDLDGKDRIITRVEFWYDAKTSRGRKAVVRLFGLE